MRLKKVALSFLAAALASAAAPLLAQARPTAAVHPFLRPMLDKRAVAIPAELKGAATGRQGSSRLQGQEALSLFVRTTATRQELETAGVKVDSLNRGVATVRVLPGDLLALASRPDVSSVSLPHPVHPHLNKSAADAGISVLRSQAAGVFTGASGKNVVVGVVDSGIDIDHPNFKNPDGTTRIVALWDQTVATVAGAPFGLGAECTPAQIDAHTCTEHDEAIATGHGTHVTGIAAGNGAAANELGATYADIGMAPESKIVFVKLDFSSSANVIHALDYVFQKADALGLPAVVNLSLGSHIGAHDGTDPEELEIDSLVNAKAGRAVVVSAGNERGDAIHAWVKPVQGTQVTGPVLTVLPYTPRPGSNNDYIWMSGYYSASDNLSVLLITPTGSAYNIPLAAGCQGEIDDFDGSVTVCNTTTSTMANQATTAREIFVVVRDRLSSKPPKAGAWRLYVTGNTVASTGKVDVWVEGTMVSNADGFTPPHFTSLADPLGTVAMPATSKQAITVGSYNTRLCWKASDNGNYQYSAPGLVLGDLSPFSSAGPTRDGRTKPDLSAPGMGIISSMADEVKASLLGNPNTSALVINNSYQLLQGTSQAAPHVTGAVALLLEKEPTLTGAQVKSKLQSFSRQDPFTVATTGALFINNYYGAGKLDLGPWAFADANETNDTPDQSTLIVSGQLMTGFVDRSGDIDYYRMQSVTTNDKLDITLSSLPADYALALLAQTAPASQCSPLTVGVKASSDQPGTLNETISYTNPSLIVVGTGTSQYIRVSSATGAFDAADSYQMKAVLTRPETTVAHATTATAQVLPDFVEMKIAGAISSNESDYYSLMAYSGSKLSVSAPGKSILVRDSSGTLLVSAGGALTNFTLPGSGGFLGALFKSKYYLTIQGAAGSYTALVTLQ